MRVILKGSLSAEDAADYDRFVASARGGHYSQARAWAGVATAGRPFRPLYFLARDGGEVVGAGLLLRTALGPFGAPAAKMERGPVTDDPRRVAEVSRALAHATRLRGVARLAIMPYWSDADAESVEQALRTVRFASAQELDGSHTYTLRLPIAGKEDQILAGGERRSLRSELKQAKNKGATARLGSKDDLATLRRLHDGLMTMQGMHGKPQVFYDRLAEQLGGPAGVFLCEHEGQAVSALLVVRHGKLATFVMGASDPAHRPFTKMALPLVEAIHWARANGCETFDLGGVPMPDDKDEKRTSIARFKYDFAKTPVRLVGEHARWL